MFSHMMVGSNDLQRSKKFYDAVFTALGGAEGKDLGSRVLYVHNGGRYLITKPLDGQAATPGNGMTIGFEVTGAEQANAWHDAGVAAGGTSIEDKPGVRNGPSGDLYLAYLRDPDGNKLCALHRIPA